MTSAASPQPALEEETVPDTQAYEEIQDEGGHCQVCALQATAPRESIVYTDDQWTATLGYDVPGWILILANRHSDDWMWGLSDQEASTLGLIIQRLSAATRAEAGAECVYMIGFGEQNRHFHFMLLTRSESMGAAGLRGPGLIENAPKLANREEAIRVGARIRERLAAVS
jgi:diadenosine tetraphosphate (Ap4A) HIT family hydrolase